MSLEFSPSDAGTHTEKAKLIGDGRKVTSRNTNCRKYHGFPELYSDSIDVWAGSRLTIVCS
eukprot:scaffold9776_cov117-Cylindrotheca_fusiformis.AAC.3